MGNAARKARKAAGEKFTHPVKEGTPMEDRRELDKLGPRARQRKLEERGYKDGRLMKALIKVDLRTMDQAWRR